MGGGRALRECLWGGGGGKIFLFGAEMPTKVRSKTRLKPADLHPTPCSSASYPAATPAAPWFVSFGD